MTAAREPSLPPHWFQILLALADSERHGLGIMQDVLDRTGGRMRLWPGMLYRNLRRLQDEGLIGDSPRPGPAEPGSPRYFHITPAGRRARVAASRGRHGRHGAHRRPQAHAPARPRWVRAGPTAERTLGDRHGQPAPGSTARASNVASPARLHPCHGPDPRAGHRGEYRDLQRREWRATQAPR